MSLTKKPLKTRPVCKVTFTLPAHATQGAKQVMLVGDFNEWSEDSHPLKQAKTDGSFSITVDLPVEQAFQFRYLVDGTRWQNDEAADAYTPTPFGNEQNSVVHT
ncbi:isoamylase early set domain-containing protein [Halothiobacillus sp. DCM-1]|uniref:isoamylase early set domain-containing protein n=1 Tax=Halothiobacillus sp. DCM-1 TaxID=3112558 RepID=UPI0032526563